MAADRVSQWYKFCDNHNLVLTIICVFYSAVWYHYLMSLIYFVAFFLAKQVKVNNKLVGTLFFSASKGAHLLFISNWARLLNNVAMKRLTVLCVTSLLPSSKQLGQKEQVKAKCLAQGYNPWPLQGLNSQPWDHNVRSSTAEFHRSILKGHWTSITSIFFIPFYRGF